MENESRRPAHRVRSLLCDTLPLGAGVVVVGVPITVTAALVAIERAQGIAMFDPELGGDPLLRGVSVIPAGIWLAYCVVQLVLLARTGTSLGQSHRPRRTWKISAGLSSLCLSAVVFRYGPAPLGLGLVALGLGLIGFGSITSERAT